MCKKLIGKTVTHLWVTDEEESLIFATDTGYIRWLTEGDCCSTSWWADVLGVDALIGGKVQSVEKVDLPEPQDERTRQEEDIAYGYKITTDKGICDLIFRNSSNGYYGGMMYESTSEEPFSDPGNRGQQAITEDWSA